MSNESESKYHKGTCIGFVAAVTCIVLEIISLICTICFGRDYDESDTSAAYASWILMAISLVGQVEN